MTTKGMWHLSSLVYYSLSDTVGTAEVIKMRRETADLHNLIFDHECHSVHIIQSGSRMEGFRFTSSDIDIMFWKKTTKAICVFSKFQQYYATARDLLAFVEICDSRPGFALLRVLSGSLVSKIDICVNIGEKLYMSSSKVASASLFLILGHYNFYPHGPCASGVLENKEIDIALCMHCDEWPPITSDFLSRCSSHLWPSSILLQDIVDGGCHFVPIGAKGSSNERHEWRISFSVAEQKLVYSMNHSQFLCYGLLKLFLKEVINKDIENCQLCSYFMKTALFWEIQIGCINIWCPHNILFCFWKCFKRMIKWVYLGWCPNFFIPRNNMFQGKIEGISQRQLFDQLYGLYELGIACLLKSDSINSIFISANRIIDLDNTISESNFNLQLIQEARFYPQFLFNLIHKVDFTTLKKRIQQLSTTDLSHYQKVLIQAYEELFKDYEGLK